MVGEHKVSDLFQTEYYSGGCAVDADTGALAQDLAGCRFKDARVGPRFKKLVRQLSQKIGQPIPMACQDWANTKAAYRFFGNRRVNEAGILAGHFQATRERAAPVDGPILILHDTTEFSFSRESPAAIGVTKTSFTDRCVHIGDRESDIYELFCTAAAAGTKFVLRTCVDRLANNGQSTISAVMKRAKVKALHRVEVRDNKGDISEATLAVRYERLRLSPPVGKQKKYPSLAVTVIPAQEAEPPKGRECIDWKLITNLPIRSRKDALEKLSWHAMRWKIETFHKS